MTDGPGWDWQHPYPGGPAITTTPLPRKLYAPGTPDHPASSPGPDVDGWKRSLSRLGRWMPWQPDKWDSQWNKQIAWGKPGGNVSVSGYAGFQRQMGWDATGIVTEKEYNALRNARIPAGLPHAGEPGMDANAINLFNEAYHMFHVEPGYDDAPLEALNEARSQLGYTEGPNNDTKYGEWYGANHQPWCAMFVTWCYIGAGSTGTFLKGARYAYVPYIVADAQAGRYGLSITTTPMAGDLVCFDWDGSDYDHVGLFETGTSSSFDSIEGNTSTSNNSNGGQVMRRERSKSQANKICFVRVAG